jgi:hypothetical protein
VPVEVQFLGGANLHHAELVANAQAHRGGEHHGHADRHRNAGDRAARVVGGALG